MFVFGLLALLSYEVAEISINSYFINFVTGMRWMDDRTASLVLTVALGFFMVECRKDDTWLIGALLQCSWIEGKCTHWSSYCDVVGCRVMIRACLGK